MTSCAQLTSCLTRARTRTTTESATSGRECLMKWFLHLAAGARDVPRTPLRHMIRGTVLLRERRGENIYN